MIYRSPYPDVDIPNVSLQDHLFEHAAKYTDKPALIDGPTGRTITYGQLVAAVRATAAGLAARGFGKGDVLAIYSPNVPEYAVAFFGVATAGGANTTVNPLYTADELKRQLLDSEARFLVTIPQFLDKATAAAAGTQVEEIFVFGEAKGATPFGALATGGGEPPDVDIDPNEDVVALPYSSGTTGLPKGVMLTHRNLVANLCQTHLVEQLSDQEVLIGILPFYHIYGMVVIMSGAIRAGGTIVTMPRFDLEGFLELLQKHGVTMAYLVPPIVLALAKHPLVDNYDLSKLQNILSGAAPLPEPVAKACIERHGVILRQGYGLTETSPVTHANGKDREIKHASVGFALPNTEYRVIDLGTETDADAGQPGEVWIRGPQVMKGYLKNPQATGDMIDEDGWLHSGDIGYADDDGYLFVVDRVKELIKYKGMQVAPAELEGVIQAHPAVADAAVIPVPVLEVGEIPKAFVVLKPDARATPEEIMAHVAASVAPHKKVRQVEFIDAIPKVPSGKILRRELRERERAAREGGTS
ncbi:MAG TPA: 4-coumarate--CoA ligase family protein [Vicinamibacterales bacterium]|nr:4-coumarate--CoA ligase family protein [Vicinamibacterales bacterium]HJN44193.1 4-coumarate--CoA ligase family protein [Vicinamibacterales bacterium]